MKKSENLSIIDRDMVFDGTISSSGKLVIKGTVKGVINGETIIVAEEGSVFCNARVTELTIGGTFEGEVEASGKLIILTTGTCSGKVICGDLIVESGGILNAEVTCKASQKHGTAAIGNKRAAKTKEPNGKVAAMG